MTAYDDLLEVQAHDTAVDRLRHRRASLPARGELATVEAAVVDLQLRLESATERQNEARRAQATLEQELGSVEAKIADLEARMYSGAVTVPRELQAMQADVEALRRRRSALEDQVLEAMATTDGVDGEVAHLEAQRSELDSRSVQLRVAIAEEEAAIDRELETESVARQSRAAALPEELAKLYDQLRTRLDGVGAARLVNGRCGGCHLTLPATELDRLRREPPDALVRCDQCGRILVRS